MPLSSCQDWCWLCGQAIDSMPLEAHYRVGSLCYGGMLTPTPTWACWSYCPISRRTLFLCCNMLQLPLVIVVLVVALAVCAVGVVIMIATSPVGVAWAVYRKGGSCTSIRLEDLSGWELPALFVMGIISGALFFCVQVVWCCVVVVWLIGLYGGKALGFRNDTSGLFDRGDRTMEVWCFPLVFTLGVLVPAARALRLPMS